LPAHREENGALRANFSAFRWAGLFLVMKRKTISKGTRFSVFTRDNFTCRYCGRQSDVVPLHIDHLIPVCEGGTNEIENLVTACADCNLGKSGKPITQHAPNETDRLRLAQERNEQMSAAEDAIALIEARQKEERALVNFWCSKTGRRTADSGTIQCMLSLCRKDGFTNVIGWIEIAMGRLAHKRDQEIGKYISGIRRNLVASGEVENKS